ncbi:MAG: type I 3-dehydroquinate dehydratase [Deltaproteobacteria bacterium]|nr:type I 3-dehydroquinate dehydratase [Deltaproteobacteria bacterium]
MIRLGDLVLDATPHIAVAITDAALDEPAWVALADCIELRIDQFVHRDVAHVTAACRAARALGKPLLATVRATSEGGAGGLDDPTRRALYAAVAPLVDGLDIELRSPLCDETVALARRHERLAIVSYHDFDRTADDATLRAVLRQGSDHGDVVKIAAAAHGPDDLARLCDLLRADGPPRIVIGMGAEGAASRVFFPLVGSLLTYSFVGEPTAPGQLALADLYDSLRHYSPSFAAAHPARGD